MIKVKIKTYIKTLLTSGLLLISSNSLAAIHNVTTESELQTAISNSVDGDTINVTSGTYNLTTTLAIAKTLTIQGTGSSLTALDGVNSNRIINFTGGTSKTLTLKNIQLQNGLSNDGSGGAGLLINSGTVNINSVSFKENSATSGNGGAIANSGTANISRTTFGFNHVLHGAANGSAIANAALASLTIDYSSILNNVSDANPSVSGAVHNQGTLTISSTVLADNTINCSVGTTVTSAGYNWQSDNSCVGLNLLTDLNNQIDHGLSNTLENNGLIQVFQPTSTSALVNKSTSTCSGIDAVGTTVPQNVKCDIGAIEYFSPITSIASASPISCRTDDDNDSDDDCDDYDDDDDAESREIFGAGSFNAMTSLLLFLSFIFNHLMRKFNDQ
ncbi:MAG: hypothetical protein ISR69_03700 [Gammaproteobacteria bacterium]|nr:hypothetical protein [Gammaproteobacteria bacterium]